MSLHSPRQKNNRPNLGPLPGAIAIKIAEERATAPNREARQRRDRRKAWLGAPATMRDIARLRRELREVAAVVAAVEAR